MTNTKSHERLLLGVIHHLIVRCNPRLLDPALQPQSQLVLLGLAAAAALALGVGWWVRRCEQPEKAEK